MARVSISSEVFHDIRFDKLAKILGIDKFSAIGRMAALWEYCTHREMHRVPKEDINMIMNHTEAARGLLLSQLASKCNASDKLYISGTKGRIEWITSLRKNSKNGGQATRAKWQAKRRPNGGPDEGTSSSSTASSTVTYNTSPNGDESETIVKSQKSDVSEADASPPSLPDLKKLWNENCDTLPQTRELSAKRKRHWKARFTARPDPPYWEEVIKRIASSEFCNGDNQRGWRAGVDFLLREDTHVKVMEGLYDCSGPQGDGRSVEERYAFLKE